MDKWFDNKEKNYRRKPERERLIRESIEDAEKFAEYPIKGRTKKFLEEYWFWIIYIIVIIIIFYYMVK